MNTVHKNGIWQINEKGLIISFLQVEIGCEDKIINQLREKRENTPDRKIFCYECFGRVDVCSIYETELAEYSEVTEMEVFKGVYSFESLFCFTYKERFKIDHFDENVIGITFLKINPVLLKKKGMPYEVELEILRYVENCLQKRKSKSNILGTFSPYEIVLTLHGDSFMEFADTLIEINELSLDEIPIFLVEFTIPCTNYHSRGRSCSAEEGKILAEIGISSKPGALKATADYIKNTWGCNYNLGFGRYDFNVKFEGEINELLEKLKMLRTMQFSLLQTSTRIMEPQKNRFHRNADPSNKENRGKEIIIGNSCKENITKYDVQYPLERLKEKKGNQFLCIYYKNIEQLWLSYINNPLTRDSVEDMFPFVKSIEGELREYLNEILELEKEREKIDEIFTHSYKKPVSFIDNLAKVEMIMRTLCEKLDAEKKEKYRRLWEEYFEREIDLLALKKKLLFYPQLFAIGIEQRIKGVYITDAPDITLGITGGIQRILKANNYLIRNMLERFGIAWRGFSVLGGKRFGYWREPSNIMSFSIEHLYEFTWGWAILHEIFHAVFWEWKIYNMPLIKKEYDKKNREIQRTFIYKCEEIWADLLEFKFGFQGDLELYMTTLIEHLLPYIDYTNRARFFERFFAVYVFDAWSKEEGSRENILTEEFINKVLSDLKKDLRNYFYIFPPIEVFSFQKREERRRNLKKIIVLVITYGKLLNYVINGEEPREEDEEFRGYIAGLKSMIPNNWYERFNSEETERAYEEYARKIKDGYVIQEIIEFPELLIKKLLEEKKYIGLKGNVAAFLSFYHSYTKSYPEISFDSKS
jgi:hypothetical protein